MTNNVYKGSISSNEASVGNQQMNEVPPRNKFIMSISPSTFKYQNDFFGYCFSCMKFWHKAQDCKIYDVIRYRGMIRFLDRPNQKNTSTISTKVETQL